MPSLSDQKRFLRRERLSLAAANAARSEGWRLIHGRTTRTYDRLAERQTADDHEKRSSAARATWASEGESK